MPHENSENLMKFINLDKELNSIYQKQSKKFEMSETTIMILYAIRASESGFTQKEIIDEYLLPKQTVNSAMKKLLNEGKVFVSDKNGREKRFLLTKEGIQMAGQSADLILEAERKAFFSFTEKEQETLIRLLEMYNSRLEDEMNKF
ncbi:MarR family winged helix-turn-helix transcriptional regulator [Butyrivibrio sp. YAB3001]|uniref:MarR family winged helix-turn-helix transcriptional regulator n=1 Tax=Butyrivibrio sp. YAB3001 TaxID=1520812 RepID=UPI0008F6515B|nr:winged helix-turn-helix transcriptional regulator [Butyrivibrio sp. YAB3001]SFC30580.1 Winged helix-turn-helix DNA-binding [Butyrivibrio sp. YAB3001]